MKAKKKKKKKKNEWMRDIKKVTKGADWASLKRIQLGLFCV